VMTSMRCSLSLSSMKIRAAVLSTRMEPCPGLPRSPPGSQQAAQANRRQQARRPRAQPVGRQHQDPLDRGRRDSRTRERRASSLTSSRVT
jgi:hypothetical protein